MGESNTLLQPGGSEAASPPTISQRATRSSASVRSNPGRNGIAPFLLMQRSLARIIVLIDDLALDFPAADPLNALHEQPQLAIETREGRQVIRSQTSCRG